ncbi:uncharacterized protein MONBRDRAFT_26753 [Monosiga brevicollis MX1]|uniref:riboflavin kinase n=1 Tax=Monosiga brevicollis TaxID=81824 RepID=A9V398_MONBE|nr:uncharacterized protein MONBRDRAFT_26753 [Monosiga brevicollis MX1]EDQ88022.1 predicted protein [Monosiga brevicollis MX1]|eukprot:XP_001747098.1 hypothetical protein [Monosiga brevicollis MX1]
MSEFTAVTLEGEVVRGFGRGSKELGIPTARLHLCFVWTANFPEDVVESLPTNMEQGIYYGWSQVGSGPVYAAVMSVGWNPFYKNEKRSAEVHIMNKFDSDFYGETMRMLVLGYIRPELNFSSLGSCMSLTFSLASAFLSG